MKDGQVGDGGKTSQRIGAHVPLVPAGRGGEAGQLCRRRGHDRTRIQDAGGLNEKRDQTIRSFIIDKDETLLFPYIKAGKYSIRLTEDLNRNGLVDTGNLLEHKQPEKVKFFKLENGNAYMDIPEMTELEQTIDVGELFK